MPKEDGYEYYYTVIINGNVVYPELDSKIPDKVIKFDEDVEVFSENGIGKASERTATDIFVTISRNAFSASKVARI